MLNLLIPPTPSTLLFRFLVVIVSTKAVRSKVHFLAPWWLFLCIEKIPWDPSCLKFWSSGREKELREEGKGYFRIVTHIFKHLDANKTVSNSVTTGAFVLIVGFSPTSQLFWFKQSVCFLEGGCLMHSLFISCPQPSGYGHWVIQAVPPDWGFGAWSFLTHSPFSSPTLFL
jgi:hypothetical protein